MRRRIGIILLIIALTTVLIAAAGALSSHVPVDDICMIVDVLIIILTIIGYIVVRIRRIPPYYVG